MRALGAAILVGGAIGALGPSSSLLGASAELIAFITLIMAGLLPAMMLTATSLRGDTFSRARVLELGDRLRKQLRFWAVLFLFALIAVIAICSAKVAGSSTKMSTRVFGWAIVYDTEPLVRVSLAIGFAALGVVVLRLHSAYRGLRSLLDLTLTMAEAQALSNDRSLSDALDAKAQRFGSQGRPQESADWHQPG